MNQDVFQQASQYKKAHQRKKYRRRVVACMASVVVICTVYALILPAITMEKHAFCGMEEHVHDESCYARITVTPTEPVCSTQPEVHTHTEECYAVPSSEVETEENEQEPHIHTDECYTLQKGELICQQEEAEGHIHSEDCYEETKELICELEENEEHSHDDSCYRITEELTCGLQESAGHQHEDTCYSWEEVLTCGLSTEPSEETGTDEAAEPEETDRVLICGKEEIQEHIHTEECYPEAETYVDMNTLICQIPEHTHSLACFSNPDADVETADDWEQILADVTLTGDFRTDVLAVAETQLGYTESKENYTVLEDGETVKGYTRYGEWYGAPYGDWCAMFASFCFCYAEIPNFPYSADCSAWTEALSSEKYGLYEQAGSYEPQPGDLVFFDFKDDEKEDAGHVGIVVELIPETDTDPARLRTIEGNSSDTVRYVTYDAADEDILGYGKMPEKETGYTCGLTGHVHSEYCEGYHGNLLCPFGEHIHGEECRLPEDVPVEERQELSYSGEDFQIHVSYGADALLPDGVTLEVQEISADSEEYAEYLAQSLAAMEDVESEEEVLFARFFDVAFMLGEEKIEPSAPVSVTITYSEQVETGENVNCQAVHFSEEGTEVLEVETEKTDNEATSFTHTQTSFSVVGDVVTAYAAYYNSADVGPDKLTVDYYVCIDGEWVCVGTTRTGWYGDYEATSWTDYNRDYITVEQAGSVLGTYGFTGAEENPARVVAYQRRSGDTWIYSDTNAVETEGKKILPLAREDGYPGYNLYYLPANTDVINAYGNLDGQKAANGFYTVKVYDAQGVLLTSEIVKTGGSFTYDASASGVESWIVAYGSGTSQTVTGSEIQLETISSSVVVSPKHEGDSGNHNVTFKVMVDGEWKTAGTLPYYYTGEFNNSPRAYITSDMAAQFLEPYGYTATTDPGCHFGYSYDDIYTIYYAQGGVKTNYCMDVAGGKFIDGTPIQLYESNSTTAQIFRIWDAGDGYSFITPVEYSNLYVNVYGGGSANNTQLHLSGANDSSSEWKLESYANGTMTFWSANNPTESVIDLLDGTVKNGTPIQIYSYNGGARFWKLIQQYRISNNTISSENSDGTYNIGLTEESNGDIVCYYLPGETDAVYKDATESNLSSENNSFWSIHVSDDAQSVYSVEELNHMVWYAQNNGAVNVTVENAAGVLWSARGKNGQQLNVASSQSDGKTTFVIRDITQPVEIVATKDDPAFTVQYYANIPRFASSGDNPLKVIDTSASANGSRKLPWNGGAMKTKNLYLEGTGQKTSQNAGDATELYRVKTVMELTKMYSQKDFEYASSPGLEYFNKLKENEDYVLKEIWILKSGKASTSTAPDDWDIYTYNSDITSFTNEVGQVKDGTLLIRDGDVIRLVFDTSSGEYYNGTTFYDYDISSGYNSAGYWKTNREGINSDSNYTGSGAKFAFGNQNCGTDLKAEAFDGNTLNKANNTNADYGKSTFGLAVGLDVDGNIQYNSQIVAPNLFNEGDATGKHTYPGSSLTFDRVGDTYTLSKATLNNSNGQSNTINELEYFFHPSPAPGKIWDGVHSGYSWQSNIFTNNFWPMDNAATERKDGNWGKYGDPGLFGTGENQNFPVGDDGNAHNWFFGMNFALSFHLTEDYEGPLEYYFFGDDDLWVFLDDQLVCDIGGVHSSIGEYVDLRDYLPVGSSGQHTLSFFYTERGASGSTCYMSFTLPSVSSATTNRDTGSLKISKSLQSTVDMDYSGEEYQFQVELLTGENGSSLNQTFSYSRTNGTDVYYGTVKGGGTIMLHQNEAATISGIPTGTYYRVTELSTGGYKTTVNGNEGYITSGTIETGEVDIADFVNTPYYELPSTGGPGTTIYILGGALLTATAGLLLLYQYKKRRKEDTASS